VQSSGSERISTLPGGVCAYIYLLVLVRTGCVLAYTHKHHATGVAILNSRTLDTRHVVSCVRISVDQEFPAFRWCRRPEVTGREPEALPLYQGLLVLRRTDLGSFWIMNKKRKKKKPTPRGRCRRREVTGRASEAREGREARERGRKSRRTRPATGTTGASARGTLNPNPQTLKLKLPVRAHTLIDLLFFLINCWPRMQLDFFKS